MSLYENRIRVGMRACACLWSALLGIGGAFGAVSNLAVVGSTPTHLVISFTADDPSSCTIEVSKSSGYTPLAADVDPAIYGSTADDCNRAGSVVNGKHVAMVIGNQGAAAMEAGADGYRYSRALQADTTYYIRVTQGSSATLEMRTANIALGNSRGEALAADTRPFSYKGVTANAAILPEFADPYTGALIKRVGVNFGFGGSSSTFADGAAPADCNKTLSGVLGSCLFADAAGTGWAATTGTLTDAVRADDSNYAEYSGTTQQPLFIRLNAPAVYPNSSTSELIGALSFQNVIIRGLTSTGTEAVDICWWLDVTDSNSRCISPVKQFNLTGTEATIRICKDAPCSAADTPGDVMFDEHPELYSMYPNTRVYNTTGDLTTWKFTGSGAQATCDGIYTGQFLYAMDGRIPALRQGVVSAKSCGSTPPQVTVGLGYDLDYNGTTGVTLFKLNGFQYNRNIGIRIRKVSTSSGATVKIGYALWRMAVNTPFSFSFGSGGFGKRCQIIPRTGTQEYLCHMSQHIVGITHGAEGLTLKNYGFFYVNSNYLGLSGLKADEVSYNCLGSSATNDSMWSDTVPGRFYCLIRSSYPNPAKGGAVDNRNVVVELDLDTSAEKTAGDPDASGAPGLSNKAQRISFTGGRIVTLCLNSCASTSDDYTLYGQFKRFDSTWDDAIFGSLAIGSVQGNLIFLTAYSGSQDSHGWVWSMDLGNGSAIGSGYTGTYGNTQHVIGGFSMDGSQACRWCAVHTFQGPLESGGAKYTVLESSTKCLMEVTGQSNMSSCSTSGGGTCSACPNVTLDGFNYNGRNWCGTLTVTSSWNGAWGSTPAGFTAGDPVAPNGCENGATGVRYWGQHLQVGDWMKGGSEFVRILEKSGNTYTVARGWGEYTSGIWAPTAHSNGDTWYAWCGALKKDPTLYTDMFIPDGVAWWPTYDSNGSNSNYTYSGVAQNHAFSTATRSVWPEYNANQFTADSPSSLKSPTYRLAALPSTFSGVNRPNCSGDACEKHPSYGQAAGSALDKEWFADVGPRLFHPSVGTNAVALASGKTYIWKWQGAVSLDPRHFDIEAFTAFWPFRWVTALTDSATDTGKACWSVVANDCFSGSSANTIYFVNEAFDTTFVGLNSCLEAQFGNMAGDACFGNSNGISTSTTQWKLPTSSNLLNGSAMRIIAKVTETYRAEATRNVKVDPIGKTLLSRGSHYYWLPTWAHTTSSKSPETWVAIKSTMEAAPPGTSTASIEFGYTPEFYCNRNRDAVCWAESATLNETTPYRLGNETYTGVSCSSGCSITIPALRNRVLYYRWKFRNSGGTVIHTGATQQPVAVN